MIKVDLVKKNKFWLKKKKKKSIFFNSIVNFFLRKYRFIKKKVNLTFFILNNIYVKK